jgi:hypothetical protein
MVGALRRAMFAELRQLAQEVDGRARVYALGATPVDGTPDLYVTWKRVDTVHERHLAAGAGLASARYDVNCWARKLSDAETLAELYRTRLDNRTGPIGDAQDSIDVSAIYVEGEDQDNERDAAGAWHRIRLDILVWFGESISPAT